MLSIENLHASYGGSLVLHGVDLSIGPGEIQALMGRNGMGKTTLMRTVMGLLSPGQAPSLLTASRFTGFEPTKSQPRG